jgi:hypothetical protein
MIAGLELGISMVDARRLPQLESMAPLNVQATAAFLDDTEIAALVPAHVTASHLYFGSEFCEHLFPEPPALERAIAVAAQLGLTLVLATPVANDRLITRILEAAGKLPEGDEILVNDWGVASALRSAQPQRRLVAGRQLAKMIKDPRLPSAAWMKPYPSGYDGAGYRGILEGLRIGRIELDVPPFATSDTFAVDGLGVSVWAPFAYVAKGRICKIGSLQREREEKFATGGSCHRECLGVAEVGSEPSVTGIVSYARGNSIYYRHDATMAQALGAALAEGLVSRLVLSGV